MFLTFNSFNPASSYYSRSIVFKPSRGNKRATIFRDDAPKAFAKEHHVQSAVPIDPYRSRSVDVFVIGHTGTSERVESEEGADLQEEQREVETIGREYHPPVLDNASGDFDRIPSAGRRVRHAKGASVRRRIPPQCSSVYIAKSPARELSRSAQTHPDESAARATRQKFHTPGETAFRRRVFSPSTRGTLARLSHVDSVSKLRSERTLKINSALCISRESAQSISPRRLFVLSCCSVINSPGRIE